MICWKCHTEIEDSPSGNVGFKIYCEQCGSFQHACINCAYYTPGKANDCSIPDTDPIIDREKYNFCEEFSPQKPKQKSQHTIDDVFADLFNEKPPKQSSSFEDLFND